MKTSFVRISVHEVLLGVLCLYLYGCSETFRNNPLRSVGEPKAVSITLFEGERHGVRVKIEAQDSLRTGSNGFDILLLDAQSNALLTNASAELAASLLEGDSLRIAPTVALVPQDGKLVGNLFLAKASAAWRLVMRWVHQGRADSVVVPIAVVPSWRCAPLQSHDARTYMVVFAEPKILQVGVQEFEWLILEVQHSREQGKVVTRYAPVVDFVVTFETLMPSMGHGSEGNRNPVHTREGRYRGRIGFNMRGDWRIDVFCFRNGVEVGRTFFFFIL